MTNLDEENSPVCIGPRTVERIVIISVREVDHPRLMFSSELVFVEKVQIAMAGITVAKFPTAVN